MIKRTTWKLSERPGSYGKPIREQVHPRARTWNEISPWNRALFMKAAMELKKIGLPPPFFAFGSRSNGNFVSESDIDIGHLEPTDKEGSYYTGLKIEGVKVDLKPTAADPTIPYIKIPLDEHE